MTKLITGGTGYIGSETARQLVNRGEQVVLFDVVINRYRIADIEDRIKIVRGDLSNFSEVLNVVKENQIDAIYHMGSMLGYQSEQNPWSSFNTNMLGTYHVMEAARLFEVPRMMMTSSRATFGLGIGDTVDDWTLQRPIIFYGWGKVYCEGVGRWYAGKFGLDFRSVRYPMVIAPNVRTPGHWGPAMIEDAIRGRAHFSEFGHPSATGPWIYIRDAAKAAIEVLEAPREKATTLNYNVAGISKTMSAGSLEAYLKEHYPGFEVTYKEVATAPPRVTTNVFSDRYAREEWGWQPTFDTLESVVAQFEKDVRELPEIYNFEW